jgi:hypothetical protein
VKDTGSNPNIPEHKPSTGGPSREDSRYPTRPPRFPTFPSLYLLYKLSNPVQFLLDFNPCQRRRRNPPPHTPAVHFFLPRTINDTAEGRARRRRADAGRGGARPGFGRGGGAAAGRRPVLGDRAPGQGHERAGVAGPAAAGGAGEHGAVLQRRRAIPR